MSIVDFLRWIEDNALTFAISQGDMYLKRVTIWSPLRDYHRLSAEADTLEHAFEKIINLHKDSYLF